MSGASGLRKHDHSSAGQGGTIASSGAPSDATYLTTTANGTLSAEVVVGATPGGELGGTWGSPTVDSTHSGSAHHNEDHATRHKSAGADSIKLNEFAAPTSAVDLNSKKLTSVADPTSAQDAATKAYVDANASGGGVGPILIADDHSTPLIFADLIQTEAEDDLVYADI